ncbi:type II toxin-antitoxin system RelE/ParE family toxin [Lysinibacillus macroides]|uniref:Plasmid stabilization protein n=2 Tax=Lysinibacillus macroides TaxID=33935 RepID=A0A0N0UWC8_9BACI|nr:plasmid stabilization protein [Lysinibacillus macroides]QPR70304.1 type II toxin-antitoxin system RelE/ParE family toxin [Lysinibacillus macroides]
MEGRTTEIQFSKVAVKFINAADKPTKARIKKAIDGLREIPPSGDIKVLRGYQPTMYRLRVGKYRIVYEIISENQDSPFIYIRDIDSRGDIYK